MNYFNDLEQEFVLKDMEVFEEFDASHFISIAKGATTGKVESIKVNLKFDYYTSMLERAIQSFSDIKLDKNATKLFMAKLSDIPKLNASNTMVKDISLDNTVFKPQYLSQYITLVQKNIDALINDEINFVTATKFMTDDYPIKVEKQIVKTTIPYGITSKELRKETNLTAPLVKADFNFIKTKVLPFVTGYEKLKQDTMTESNAVLNSIKEAEVTVKAMLNALNKLRAVEGISSAKINEVNQLAYNSIRGIIDVVAFVSFNLIHKLNVISSNVITLNRLYTTIFNLHEGNVTEASLDRMVVNNDEYSCGSKLIQGQVPAYTILANNIYEYHMGMLDQFQSDDNGTDRIYPKDIFEEIVKAYIIISEGLNIIAREGDDYLLIFDDIINKSGFSLVLVDRFREVINNINDLSMYSNDGIDQVAMDVEMYLSMLTEVKNYPDNMQKIADACHETFNKLIYLQERFADNINGEFADMETCNELKVFMKDLKEQYVDMTNTIANNAMTRLRTIGEKLVEMEATNPDVAYTSDNVVAIDTSSDVDISESAFDLLVEEKATEIKNHFNELQKQYIREKMLALENVNVIFEAEAAPANGSTDNTKPTVIDNSKPEDNGGNNTPQTSSATVNSVIDQILKFFEDMRNKMNNIITKNSKHNQEFLNANKDGLLNRSYNNVTIQIVNYDNVTLETIKGQMNQLTHNVARLSPQVIQGFKSISDVYKNLTPFISGMNATEDTEIKKQMYNFYAMGNVTSDPANKNVSNGELKTFVANEMIPYCETYYGFMADTFVPFTNDISDKLKDVASKLDTGNVNNQGATVKESAMTEADAGVNTETSMSQKMKWVLAVVRLYTNSLSDVLRSRNNAYLKILNSLKVEPKATGGPAKVTDGNDRENQPNQNQAQPQQQV